MGIDLSRQQRCLYKACFNSLVIPVKKIVLDEATISRPIPTLSDRQFVVASSKLTNIEERAQRELFWYREELFKSVSARWHEVGHYSRSRWFRCPHRDHSDWWEAVRRVVIQSPTDDPANAGVLPAGNCAYIPLLRLGGWGLL